MAADRFKKQVTSLLDGTDITDDDDHVTDSVDGYSATRCCLLLELESTGSPSSLTINLQVTGDNPNSSEIKWYNLQTPDFLPSNWNAADCSPAIRYAYYLDFPAGRMRLSYSGTGCDDSNYFTISATTITYTY